MAKQKTKQNIHSLCWGPSGVGVTELKRRLLLSDADVYGTSVPCKAKKGRNRLHFSLFIIGGRCHPLANIFPSRHHTWQEKPRDRRDGLSFCIRPQIRRGHSQPQVHEIAVVWHVCWSFHTIHLCFERKGPLFFFFFFFSPPFLTFMSLSCPSWTSAFRFIDYGTYRGHYYGTSLNSVYRVMAEGKVCLLDVHPCVSIKEGSVMTWYTWTKAE